MGAAVRKGSRVQNIEDAASDCKRSYEAYTASKSVQTRTWLRKAKTWPLKAHTHVSNSGPAIAEVQLPGSSVPGCSSISQSPILQERHTLACPPRAEANEGTSAECYNCVVQQVAAFGLNTLSSSAVNLVGPSAAVNSAERASAEEAALSAIRTTLKCGGQAATDDGPTKASTNCLRTVDMLHDPFRILELEPLITTVYKEVEETWPAQISIESRKVMLYWLKHARRTIKEEGLCIREEKEQASKAAAQRRNAIGSSQTKRARVDCLVQMYAEREEELARHCLQEPDHMLTAQMDSLTHCANSLSGWNLPSPKGGKRRTRSCRSIRLGGPSRRRHSKPGIDGPDGPWACGRAWSVAARRSGVRLAVEESGTHEDFGSQISGSEALDEAIRTHGKWRTSRDDVHKQITSKAASRWQAEQAAFSTATALEENAKLVAELQAERERIAALLPLFEASVKKQQRKREQKNVDMFESMQEARRCCRHAADCESWARRRRADRHGAL